MSELKTDNITDKLGVAKPTLNGETPATLESNNVFTGTVTISNSLVIMSNLPTVDPVNAGQLWNNSGVLSVSSGV